MRACERAPIDPHYVQDVFVEGIASVDVIGTECVRVQLYQTRQDNRVIVVSLVWPLEQLYEAHMQMRRFVHSGLTTTEQPVPN